jgi:hypothetical protein
MNLNFLIAVFPIVFMFHDFEEIIFFKTWLTKNRDYLKNRFPKISRHILPHFEKLSTAAFSLAVAEEFILISIITFTSIWLKNYFLWFAIFIAFSLHLVAHIIQWIILKRYIPSIVTSLLCLPYCIYTFNCFLLAGIMSFFQIAIWTMIGIVIMVLNLVLAHKLALVFEKWKTTLT